MVKGNDLTVVALASVYDAGSGAYIAFNLGACTGVTMRLVRSFNRIEAKSISIDGDEVTATFAGSTLTTGTYGVEILFSKDGQDGRIFEDDLFAIVTDSGDASIDTAAGGGNGQGYNITVDIKSRTLRVGQVSGITDYNLLENRPSIGGVTLEGNKTPEELGMYSKEEPDSELSETSENCVQNRVVTGAIRELQDYCFPTSLEASISPSSAEWTGNSVEVSVSFRVLRNSKPVVADTVQIQFNGETKTLENVAKGSEKFTLSTQGYKSGSVTAKKGSTTIKNSPRSISANLYLPVYYGFSKATTGNELTITSLTKGGSSLNGTKTLTNDDATKYLWLCVPNTMSINKVTSSGFDVPFLAPVEASTPLGTYKCYRTKDLPGAGSMTIVIS